MQERVDHVAIAKAVGVLFAGFPAVEAGEETIKLYVRLLSDIPLEVLSLCVEQFIAQSKFLPTVAEIREQALKLTRPDRISALEAWGLVKEQMRLKGSYRSPEFSDPLIAKAVECIGWKTLCGSENEPADRAHFSKVYDSLVQRDEADARLLPSTRKFLEERSNRPVAGLLEAAGHH